MSKNDELNDKLEEMLSSINGGSKASDEFKRDASQKSELREVENIKSTIVLEEEAKQLGFFNKMKANSLKSKKELEAQEVIFNTQIKRLQHEAEATERQSKAFWDAKSVDFSEGLKTYAQQSMQLLENARLENKTNAITEAYEIADRKMKEILAKSIPDSVKFELISKINDARDNAVKRLEQDMLANKYSLGPDSE